MVTRYYKAKRVPKGTIAKMGFKPVGKGRITFRKTKQPRKTRGSRYA